MFKINDVDNKYGINTNNRWASEEEIKSGAQKNIVGKRTDNGSGLPVYSDGKVIYTDTSDSHSVIFGNTGSKKSRLLAMPIILSLADSGESMIISDPKSELYDRTAGYLNKRGYAICTKQMNLIRLKQTVTLLLKDMQKNIR